MRENLESKIKENIDHLIDHFWKDGLLTVCRKYGRFLPAPEKIGSYEVDAVAIGKDKIVLGFVHNVFDNKLKEKLVYLSGRRALNNKKIEIYVGIQSEDLLKAQFLLEELGSKNIFLKVLDEQKKEILVERKERLMPAIV